MQRLIPLTLMSIGAKHSYDPGYKIDFASRDAYW